MVQPRPASDRPLPAFRARRAQARELILPRREKERGPMPGALPATAMGPARRDGGVGHRDAGRRVRRLGGGERHRGRLLRPELPVRRARACASRASGRSAASSGSTSRASTSTGRWPLDVIYSLTALEQAAHSELGHRDPAGHLGDAIRAGRGFSEALGVATTASPGSSSRAAFSATASPIEAVIEAFSRRAATRTSGCWSRRRSSARGSRRCCR